MPFSGSWPRSGTMQSGAAFERQMSARLTDEIDGSAWPTATARDYKDGDPSPVVPTNALLGRAAPRWPTPTAIEATKHSGPRRPGDRTLTHDVKNWPTPTAGDSKASGGRNASPNCHDGMSLTDATCRIGAYARNQCPDSERGELRNKPEQPEWRPQAPKQWNAIPRNSRRPRLASFPPGPGDSDAWRRILAERPDLAPAIKSGLRGVDDGASIRVDRLRALGNAVVPAQAEAAFLELWERMLDG